MKSAFKSRVYELVAAIPKGKVMTYGSIAALCGKPRAARAVGTIAHYGSEEIPWHRVVNKSGGMASGYWGGKEQHARHLEAEGVIVKNYKIENLDKHAWRTP